MAEDDKRAADTLEEIRDLLTELRDLEKGRSEELVQQLALYQETQKEWLNRQRFLQRFAAILLCLLVPLLGWLVWWLVNH